MTGPWVLMYHRVCERDAGTRCWFERGTAVTPAAFDRHLQWLGERFDIVPLDALHEPAPRVGRPRVALTFDDGYRDTLAEAAPICAARGVTAVCFVAAGPIGGGAPLWFDAWYRLVQVGLERPAWHAVIRDLGGPPATDLTACVTGPAKQWLARSTPGQRQAILGAIVIALDVPRVSDLYLDVDDLVRLQRAGWRIGGHGVDHTRLSDCDVDSAAAEIEGAWRLLDSIGEPGPRCFAYPDGAWSVATAVAVARAGFAMACTTRGAPWVDTTDRLAIPRLFCRGDAPSPHRLLEVVA